MFSQRHSEAKPRWTDKGLGFMFFFEAAVFNCLSRLFPPSRFWEEMKSDRKGIPVFWLMDHTKGKLIIGQNCIIWRLRLTYLVPFQPPKLRLNTSQKRCVSKYICLYIQHMLCKLKIHRNLRDSPVFAIFLLVTLTFKWKHLELCRFPPWDSPLIQTFTSHLLSCVHQGPGAYNAAAWRTLQN